MISPYTKAKPSAFTKFVMFFEKKRTKQGIASNQVLTLGLMMFGMMTSVFAVDIPLYYTAQNQLQTAVNAAALAGAAQLPIGEAEAEAAAAELAAMNPVVGTTITDSDLSFESRYGDEYSFIVTGTKEVPTVISRFLCAAKASGGGEEQQEQSETGGDVGGEQNFCNSMTVTAAAKAVPAARDVILVIDTSGSMDSLGNGQPFRDVKEAAHAYIDQVVALNSEAVDRIGVVTFDYSSNTAMHLTSYNDSHDFEDIKDAIDDLTLYNGSQWWNTNYYSGLKAALDEMEANGRKNATKNIIFLTDGYPNVPDGPDWNYKDCINAENNGDQYMNYANKYYRRGNRSYGDYYYNKAQQKYDYSFNCTTGYTEYMVDVTQAQADRAYDMEVTVHTIQIGPPPHKSSSLVSIRDMLNDNEWDSELLWYIANTSEGEQYEAATNDGDGITDIYETIAQDVRMRLAH